MFLVCFYKYFDKFILRKDLKFLRKVGKRIKGEGIRVIYFFCVLVRMEKGEGIFE